MFNPIGSITLIAAVALALSCASVGADAGDGFRSNLAKLRRTARKLVKGSRIPPGGSIPGHTNQTPYSLLMPGANAGYPAFWVRDAAMTMGAGLATADEVEGWIRLIASVQAGPEGGRLARGLTIPPFSIPDHITFSGNPCWFPGAYDGPDQGDGTYGFLPPADDAFYLVQMVREQARLSGTLDLFKGRLKTGWSSSAAVSDVCRKAFDSVQTLDGAVFCSPESGKSRVDWGFCDAIHKNGKCLMPTLLRWRAALDLSELHRLAGENSDAAHYSAEADASAAAARAFIRRAGSEAWLVSSTGLGCQPDVWASAYAVWLGALEPADARAVSIWLLRLYRESGTVEDGQARHLPPGEFWAGATVEPGVYQNGAYWGTPSGWLIYAISLADAESGRKMLSDLVSHIEKHEAEGAPWECINNSMSYRRNDLYCASAALPYSALLQRMEVLESLFK